MLSLAKAMIRLTPKSVSNFETKNIDEQIKMSTNKNGEKSKGNYTDWWNEQRALHQM